MKLVSFERAGGNSYGVSEDGAIRDVGALLKGRYPTLRSALGATTELATAAEKAPLINHEDVSLLPPITDPARIVCVGLNYRSHIVETGRGTPDYPILFPRYPDSLVGHGASLVRPRVSTHYDFEGELAVVIGKPGRHVGVAQAMDHVAGYACFNDGSIRDYQRRASQFMPGKCFWRSGAFGPWLVTTDQAPAPTEMQLQTRLNGEVMQDAGVSDLLFDIPTLVSCLSEIWPLQVGDVIATGTTGGVGEHRKPPVWLTPGDTIEVEISGLGTLSNSVVDE